MEKTFETSLQELETIVRQLEAGDLPLEESLKLFEKGVQLSRECRERLNQAERRIEVLMKDADGNASLREMDPESLRADRKPANSKRIVFEDDDQPF
jgi:exodeoxyribonuclease VII small subunit